MDVHDEQDDIGSFFLALGLEALGEYDVLAEADREYGEDVERELRDRVAARRS